VIDGLEVLVQGLAPDGGDAMLDDLSRFPIGERIALDGVRGISQLDIVVLLKLCERCVRQRPQRIEAPLSIQILENKFVIY